MRVTINDIAKASGFSKTSVSFAFNDPGRISKETRDKILNIADNLGYVPDPVARNLSMRKIGTIGLLVPQAIHQVFRNPYMNEILMGIGQSCESQDYSLTVVPPLRGKIFDGVRSAAVDGFITMGLHPQMKLVRLIRQRHIPFVTIDGTPADDIPGVNTHDEQAAYEMMKKILEYGHRKIAVFGLERASGSDDDIYRGPADWRMQGFTKAMEDFSVNSESLYYCDVEPSLEGGRKAIDTMMSQLGHDMPTVIACMSDITAIGAMTELQDRGINVPGTISITGFDNIPEASLVSPKLTSISQPGFEIGRQSADMLFELLAEKKTHRHIFFDSSIVERDSLIRL